MMNLIAYADGTNDLIDISNIIDVPVWKLYAIVDTLAGAGLLVEEEDPAPRRRVVQAGEPTGARR